MLQFYNTNMNGIINKYRKEVTERLSSPSFDNPKQNELHTKYIANCQRGSKEAKNYVLDELLEIVKVICTDNDKNQIMDIVKKEYNTFNQKQYETYDLLNNDIYKESKISYYQLLGEGLSEEQNERLNEISRRLDDKELGCQILAEEIFNVEYGLSVVESIKEMRLNNLEIHDTYKIRVELANGTWYTISDCRFNDSNDVSLIARRLLNEKSGGDLTADECERQTILLDGSRITVTLMPASTMNVICIKKFDSFIPTKEGMIEEGTITEEVIRDLEVISKGRGNIAFSGGVNSGKSTMLKMYAGLIPTKYKLGMIDPTKDTDLKTLYPEKDIITLYETSTYSMNDQFSFMLTMGRDIIGLSEAKSFEVLQSIKGMTRANSGSFLSIHTLRAKDIVDNIAYMCLENGIPQDLRILRARIASALDITVRTKQLNSGKRVLDEMSEIVATGDLDNPFETRIIWYWDVKQNKIVRNKDYTPSDDLLDKFRYYGCTEEEIERFCNG